MAYGCHIYSQRMELKINIDLNGVFKFFYLPDNKMKGISNRRMGDTSEG